MRSFVERQCTSEATGGGAPLAVAVSKTGYAESDAAAGWHDGSDVGMMRLLPPPVSTPVSKTGRKCPERFRVFPLIQFLYNWSIPDEF